MIWLRILLAGLLFAVCAWLGRAKARKLDLRTKALGDVIKFSRQLEALIRVNGRAIPEAISECARQTPETWTSAFAENLAMRYGLRQGASGHWAAALKNSATESEEAAALTADDIRMISLFGDQLASMDMRSIIENFAFLYATLSEQMRASDKDRAVKGRLYGSIGLLAGLAAAVLVL